MRQASTSDMIVDVAPLVSYLSHQVQLRPDDLLITELPARNSTHHGRILRDGDVLEGEIAPPLGLLRNRCVGTAAA